MFRNLFASRTSGVKTRKPTRRVARKTTNRLELESLEGRLLLARFPDFSLPDLHPSTPTSGQNVGPSAFRGSVSGYYFTNPG